MQDLALPYFLTRGLWGAGTIFATFLLAVGIIKIRQWHRENIIKSKGMFNLAIFMLIVAVMIMMNFIYILLPGRTSPSYTMTIIFFVITLISGWIVFLLATIKPVRSKQDDTDEVMENIYKRKIKRFILHRVIIPAIAVLLFPIILFGIAVIQAKFFK